MSVYVQRLDALASRLEEIARTPPEKRKRTFDMTSWIERVRTPFVRKSCGTAACAMGEACYIPLLKKAGLRIRRTTNSDRAHLPAITRAGRTYVGTEAAEKLFGISEAEAHHLFMPYTGNNLPEQVAVKIRDLIREKQTERAATR